MVTLPADRPGLRSLLALDIAGWIQLGAATGILGLMLFHPQVLGDADTYWHLAAGDWILDHWAVPRVDVFSHTFAGRPWTPHEWLSEVLMSGAFRLGGWSGLVLLYGLALAATVALIAGRLARFLGPLALASTLVLAFYLIAPGLLTRPHILVLPVTALWVIALLDAREQDRAPTFYLAPLMVVWANLHGSWPLGFVVMAPLALEAVLEPKADVRRVMLGWGGVGLSCVAAAALTPHGVQGLLYPFQVTGMGTLNEIVEWRPADFSSVQPFEVVLLGTLAVCLWRGVKVPPIQLLLLLGLLHMSLQHLRHQTVLAVVGPLILAQPIGAALDAPAVPLRRRGVRLALFGLLALVLAGVRFAQPIVRGDGRVTLNAALAQVPAELRARPVFNAYDFGGYLIFAGVRPFIDGRADMYGDAFFRDYTAARAGGPALDKTLARYHVDWTILQADEIAVADMDRKPGWRRLWADKHAVVHVRNEALPAGP